MEYIDYKECLTQSQLSEKDQEAWGDFKYANCYCASEDRVYDNAEENCILKVSFTRNACYVIGNIKERNYKASICIERPIGFSINDELTIKKSVISLINKTIKPYNERIKNFITQHGQYNEKEKDYYLLDSDERSEAELFTLINDSLRKISEDLRFDLSDYNIKTCCVTLEDGERRLAKIGEYINEIAIKRINV